MDDAERRTAIDALDPNDGLTLYIGRVSRSAVLIENTLRHVWINLAGRGLTILIAPTGVRRLVEQCSRMLKGSPRQPEELKAAGLDALRDTKAANEKRNRYVHDLWMVDRSNYEPDTNRFIKHRVREYELGPSPTTVTQDDLESTVEDLRSVWVRIDMLEWAVWRLAMSQSVEDEAIAVIRGDFDWRDGVPHLGTE